MENTGVYQLNKYCCIAVRRLFISRLIFQTHSFNGESKSRANGLKLSSPPPHSWTYFFWLFFHISSDCSFIFPILLFHILREQIPCKWSQTVFTTSSHLDKIATASKPSKGEFCREMTNSSETYKAFPIVKSEHIVYSAIKLPFFRQPRVSWRLGKGICQNNKQASHQIIFFWPWWPEINSNTSDRNQSDKNWANQPPLVQRRFENTVVAQFHGHTHNDHFEVW